MWDRTFDPAVVPLFLQLQWAQGQSLAAMRPLLALHGLSTAEFDVLATLRNAPAPHEMTPTGIQQEMVITSGGLTKVMLQLEARQLVERLSFSDDRRVKPIRLTDQGRERVEAAMAGLVAETGRWVRSALAEDEIATLSALLARLASAGV